MTVLAGCCLNSSGVRESLGGRSKLFAAMTRNIPLSFFCHPDGGALTVAATARERFAFIRAITGQSVTMVCPRITQMGANALTRLRGKLPDLRPFGINVSIDSQAFSAFSLG